MALHHEIHIPVIKTVYIADGIPVGKRVPIRFESANNNEDSFLGQQQYAIVIGGAIPAPNTRGVVIYQDQFSKTCFWIGEVDDGSKQVVGNSPIASSVVTSAVTHESNDKTTTMVLGSKKTFFGTNEGGYFSSSDQDVIIGMNTHSVRLHKNGLEINIANSAKINLGNESSLLLNRLTVKTLSSIMFKSGGIVAITGPIENATADNLTDPANYAPNEGFFVTTKKMFLKTSGLTQLNSGGLKIQLASAQFSAGGQMPGTGSPNTLDISIIKGNGVLSVGQGSVTIRTNNYTATDSIDIVCGSSINPINAGVSFNTTSAVLSHRLVWGIEASFKASNSSATISAFKDVEISATTGNFNVSAMMNAKIEAIIKTAISSMQVEIEGKVQTAIKTALLDLKESKLVDMGLKTVAPNPAGGPFNCMMVCPFSGQPHQGDKAVG